MRGACLAQEKPIPLASDWLRMGMWLTQIDSWFLHDKWNTGPTPLAPAHLWTSTELSQYVSNKLLLRQLKMVAVIWCSNYPNDTHTGSGKQGSNTRGTKTSPRMTTKGSPRWQLLSRHESSPSWREQDRGFQGTNGTDRLSNISEQLGNSISCILLEHM